MRYIIHGIDKNGISDSFVVDEDTIEKCRELAQFEVSMRGWRNCWSERG